MVGWPQHQYVLAGDFARRYGILLDSGSPDDDQPKPARRRRRSSTAALPRRRPRCRSSQTRSVCARAAKHRCAPRGRIPPAGRRSDPDKRLARREIASGAHDLESHFIISRAANARSRRASSKWSSRVTVGPGRSSSAITATQPEPADLPPRRSPSGGTRQRRPRAARPSKLSHPMTICRPATAPADAQTGERLGTCPAIMCEAR